MNDFLKYAWKLVILVIGGTVLLLGVVLIVAPGPAFIVIPVGLAILATEFAWARRWLKKVKAGIRQATDKLNITVPENADTGTHAKATPRTYTPGPVGEKRPKSREKW